MLSGLTGKLRNLLGLKETAPLGFAPTLDASERGCRLLFRYGFLAHLRGDRPPGDSTWQALDASWPVTTIGSIILRTHPETEIWHDRPSDSVEVAIIGRAFSIDGARLTARDIVSNTPQALRRLTGRFALVISSGDDISVFHDAFGARTVFYKTKGQPVFASHASLIAHAWKVPRDAAMSSLVATPEYSKRIVKYLPGDATMYEGILALVPNNRLEFPSMNTTRYWPDRPIASSSFEDFFCEIDTLFRSSITHLAQCCVPVFGITGGIDSRCIFAAWQKHGAAFHGVTWKRQYLKPSEILPVAAIVHYLNRPHDTIEFTGEFDREIAAVAAVNCGEYRGASQLTAEMHKLFGDDPRNIFVRGYGGEIVRGFYNTFRQPMADASPAEMTRVYGAQRSTQYGSLAFTAFKGFARRANYKGIDRLGFDINDIFYWEHRMGMWGAAMLNEMDAAMFSFVGINSRAVFERAFGLPRDERLTKDLLRRVVRRYDTTLAEVEVSE
jgi:hypothetical protein